VVLLNMSDGAVGFREVRGTVVVATDGTLDGSVIEGALTLGPWSGAVVAA
jgi:hypothetical protein